MDTRLPTLKYSILSFIPEGTSDVQQQPSSSEPGSQAFSDKTFVFVGDKLSGKTSRIAKLLDEPVKDDMKETTALDFRYGTRVKEDKKQKLNIYELGKNT